MTKDKLMWLGKDKLKLMKELRDIKDAYQSLNLEYDELTKESYEAKKELRETIVKVDIVKKGRIFMNHNDLELEKSISSKYNLEAQVKVLNTEITDIKKSNPKVKGFRSVEDQIEFYKTKLAQSDLKNIELQNKNDDLVEKIKELQLVSSKNL